MREVKYFRYNFTFCKACYKTAIELLADTVYMEVSIGECNTLHRSCHVEESYISFCHLAKIITEQSYTWKFTNSARREILQVIREFDVKMSNIDK
jgi:hypothetical protein